MIHKRQLHSSTARRFKLIPNYVLKCGLEIHTQLKTREKLFSLSPASFNSPPNSNVSFFDCGLPGTMPKLNPQALFLALKAAVALDFKINTESSFDRKHYFYPDQPLGYQITQYFHPLAEDGVLKLNKEYDQIEEDFKCIRLERIQIEQDTGKTTYMDYDKTVKVDLNRANIPLIELVTKPDFENFAQVKAFLRKYNAMVYHLDICTGDLETGAMRADVNVSVNGGPRVEIKNLGGTGEIHDAMKYEYNRQVTELKAGMKITQETRSWDGNRTIRSRSKEDRIDYRYFPDSELPKIFLDSNINSDIKEILEELPDEILEKLTKSPYNLELKHAKFLIDNKDLLKYYIEIFGLSGSNVDNMSKQLNNWLINGFLGTFNKLEKEIDLTVISPQRFVEFVNLVYEGKITSATAKIFLKNLLTDLQSRNENIEQLLKKYNLHNEPESSDEKNEDRIASICSRIIKENEDVVSKVKNGKKNPVKYLVGLAMRETRGKIDAKSFEAKLLDLIQCK